MTVQIVNTRRITVKIQTRKADTGRYALVTSSSCPAPDDRLANMRAFAVAGLELLAGTLGR
jgi:hypothetical protein